METQILHTQLKVPEDSKLVGNTIGEIREKYGIKIDHKHNPRPSKRSYVKYTSDNQRVESDKFIHFSGKRKDILRFTEDLLKDC